MSIRLLLCAAAVLIALAAPAEARYACAVKRTSDGFVALREGPSPRHTMIARMRPQELVGLLHPDRGDDVVSQGNWFFATWYPGTRRTAFEIPAMNAATARTGWVNYSLLDCFEE